MAASDGGDGARTGAMQVSGYGLKGRAANEAGGISATGGGNADYFLGPDGTVEFTGGGGGGGGAPNGTTQARREGGNGGGGIVVIAYDFDGAAMTSVNSVRRIGNFNGNRGLRGY